MNLPNFWYGSCSYGPLSENHTLYGGKILIWRNLVHLRPFFGQNWQFWGFLAFGDRGGPGPKIQVNLIWKCFSIRSQRFLRNVNISHRSRDIHVQVRPGMSKIAFFREFSNIKIALKMSQNHEYFHPKWLLNMFGDIFLCIYRY